MSEYFQLRDYLSRANRLSNQLTEIRFEIEQVRLLEYTLFAVSYAKNETHRLALVERSPDKNWERAGHTRFQLLEEFCAKCLNNFETAKANPSRARRLTDKRKLLLEQEVSSRLKMLLLNKSYEP